VSFVDSTAFGKDADTTQAIKSGVAGKTWVYTYAQLVSWLQSVGGESDMSAPVAPAAPNADGISPSFNGPIEPQISPALFFAPVFFCGTSTQNTDVMAALYTKALGDLGGWNSTPVSATVVIYDPSYTKGSLATAALLRVQQGLAKGITYDQLNEYLQTQNIAVPGAALPSGGAPTLESTPAELTAFFGTPGKSVYFAESAKMTGKQEAYGYDPLLKGKKAKAVMAAGMADLLVYEPGVNLSGMDATAFERAKAGEIPAVSYPVLLAWLQGKSVPDTGVLPDPMKVPPLDSIQSIYPADHNADLDWGYLTQYQVMFCGKGGTPASVYATEALKRIQGMGKVVSTTASATNADLVFFDPYEAPTAENELAALKKAKDTGDALAFSYSALHKFLNMQEGVDEPAAQGPSIPAPGTMLPVYSPKGVTAKPLSWSMLEGENVVLEGSWAPQYVQNAIVKPIAKAGHRLTLGTMESYTLPGVIIVPASKLQSTPNFPTIQLQKKIQDAVQLGASCYTIEAFFAFLAAEGIYLDVTGAPTKPVEAPTPNVPAPPAIDGVTAPAMGLYPTIPAGTNKPLTLPMITGGKLVFGPKAGVASGPAAYKTVLKNFAPTVTTKMNLATVMFFDPADTDATTAQIKAYANHGSCFAWTYDQLDLLLESVGLTPPAFTKGKGGKPQAQHLPSAPSTLVAGEPVHLSLALLKGNAIYVVARPGETENETAKKVYTAFKDKGLELKKFQSASTAASTGMYVTASVLFYPAEGMNDAQKKALESAQAKNVPCFTYTQLDQVAQQVGVAIAPQPGPVDMSSIYPNGKEELTKAFVSGKVLKMLPTSVVSDQSDITIAYVGVLTALNATGIGQFAGQKADVVIFDEAMYPSDAQTKKFVDFAKAGSAIAFTYAQLNALIKASGNKPPLLKAKPVTPSYNPSAPSSKAYAVPPGLYKAKIYDGIEPCVPARNKNINYPAWNYSGGAYHGYNDPLTFGTTPGKGDQQEIEDLVLDLLLGNDKAAVLYRGVRNEKAVGKYMTAEMKPGHVFLKPAFFSASKKRSVAEGFGGTAQSYHRNIMFVLDTTEVKGIYLGTASQCSGEAELLLPPRITLTITEVVDNGMQRELRCKARMDPQFTHPDPVGKVARLSDAVVSIEERLAALSKGGATASLIEDDDWA
jgi:hypothetical protein